MCLFDMNREIDVRYQPFQSVKKQRVECSLSEWHLNECEGGDMKEKKRGVLKRKKNADCRWKRFEK